MKTLVLSLILSFSSFAADSDSLYLVTTKKYEISKFQNLLSKENRKKIKEISTRISGLEAELVFLNNYECKNVMSLIISLESGEWERRRIFLNVTGSECENLKKEMTTARGNRLKNLF